MVYRRRSSPNRISHDEENLLNHPKSSLECTFSEKLSCDVSIFDEPLSLDPELLSEGNPPIRFSLTSEKLNILPPEYRTHLESRNTTKNRWIHLSGRSPALADDLAERYLDNHECLKSSEENVQTLGGPVRCADGKYFFWAQLPIYFVGQDCSEGRSTQCCTLRLIICLPALTKAGTVITTLTGHSSTVDHVSHALTTNLLENHAMGAEAVSCVWIIASSLVRQLIEQVGMILNQFDPLKSNSEDFPRLGQLHTMLEQANSLARIERYIASIGETLEFLDALQSFQRSQVSESNTTSLGSHTTHLNSISPRSRLEATITTQKYKNTHQLCRAYIEQHQVQIQMMLSHSTAAISNKIENGSKVAERIAAVGVVLAAISGVTSPLSLLTGYFGMNVAELVDGGQSSLYDFWTVAMPVLALSVILLGVMLARVMATSKIFGRR